MTKKELSAILSKHSMWLHAKEGGERANLQGADLQHADLQHANLQGANLWGANLRGANLRGANLQGANLQGANLWGANLHDADLWGANLWGANLRDANLWGADLDFSCLPLWCGGSRFKADARLVRQLMAHIVTIDVQDSDDDLKAAIEAIRGEAGKSHRADDLGLL